MLSTWLLAGVCLFAYAAVSGRLEHSMVTPPMVFTAIGVGAGSWGLGLITDEHAPFVHTLAEVTLILVLFTDAARMNLGLLKAEHDIPVRLLALGMPATILAGAGLALIFFAQLSWAEAAVLAAVLAPTDAALGQAVVTNPLVPTRIRQALNVESGLNDGIALPFVLILLSLAGAPEAHSPSAWGWAGFTVMQVTLGPMAGIAVGWLGGKALEAAEQAHTITKGFRDLAVIALAFVAFAAAESIGGNGFIAAFVGGLTLGNTARDHCSCLYDFSESEGQLLTIATFAVFGAVMVPHAFEHIDLRVVGYTITSLTVIRMVPVALAVLGKGLGGRTILFLGWFGPRGLATILFALLVVEEAALPHAELLLSTAVCTVIASTILHGMTAFPLASRYGAWAKSRVAEHHPLAEMPLRVSRHPHHAPEAGPPAGTGAEPTLTWDDRAKMVRPDLADPANGALVAQLKAGDEVAFRALARGHGPRLLAVARRYLDADQAHDCLQEALTVAFVKISTLQDPERLAPWLNRVVINCALMRIRHHKRRREESLDEWLPTFDERDCRIEPDRGHLPTPEELLNVAQARDLVQQAICSLPPVHRAVLMLRDIDGYSTKEAAELLDIEPGALKVRLHRARAALKKKLEPLMSGGPL